MYRVYVDEAGDRGMKPASSDHFAVSAIIVATVALLGISLGLVPTSITQEIAFRRSPF